MHVSSHSASFLSPKTQEESALARQCTGSSGRSVPASYQPPVESREDDVVFVLSVAFAEKEQRDAVDSSLLSPIEKIEQVRQPRVELKPILRVKGSKGRGATSAPAAVSVAAGSGVASDPSVSSNHRSRVFFPEKPVTAVKEIPSCLLMTAEEKNVLYRDKRTLRTESDRFWVECVFEGSQHCCDNAFEETIFFCNHLGESVHPAHFLQYAREVLPNLHDVVTVPGFASFDAYLRYMVKCERLYDGARRDGLFPPLQS